MTATVQPTWRDATPDDLADALRTIGHDVRSYNVEVRAAILDTAAERLEARAEPVGLVELAQRLGRSRGVVDQWRNRDRLPPPRWHVGGRPAWDWPDIVAWCHATGRADMLREQAS